MPIDGLLTVGELFAGIGGFGLGFERTGKMRIVWQVEIERNRRYLLRRRYPMTYLFADVRTFMTDEKFKRLPEETRSPDILCGGDPCPAHSHARSNGPSIHPDLSGYFLSVAGRLRPRWVVRENVPAPTVDWFATALEALGYGCAVVRCNSYPLTCQVRKRDYIIGCYQATGKSISKMFQKHCDVKRPDAPCPQTVPFIPCLTTHPARYDSHDCYIWEPPRGLRILDSEEREKAAGFPVGWTAGLSETERAVVCGNAVVPAVAEFIGRRIISAHRH